jgi:hypothetical protein
MRLAIFSDVHGNPFACRAVLGAIARAGTFDAILVAGDLCLGGSDPAGCIEQLNDAGVQAVYGNTEQYLRFPDQIPPDELHRSMWERVQPAVYWTLARLSPDQLSWVGGLPFERRFSPVRREMSCWWCASPKTEDDLSTRTEQRRRVRRSRRGAELQECLSGVAARLIAFGHFHYMFQRSWREKILAGVGCCSLPGIDHDRRARFSIIEWVKTRWLISQQWVDYDRKGSPFGGL